MTEKCPNCGMELPPPLLAQHVEFCSDEVSEEVEQVIDEANDTDYFDFLGTADESEDRGGEMVGDLDAEFARLVGMLDLEVADNVNDVVVTVLDDAQLSSRYNEVREELMQRGEMINPKTQTGRDLHSQRAAYIIEMRKRGLMT